MATELDNDLTADVINAAVEVHRMIGPGLLESIYERCLKHELEIRGHTVQQQQQVEVVYKDIRFAETLRCDLIVNGQLLLELKVVEQLMPLHKAQTLSYLKLLNLRYGLLINFNQSRLVDGLNRLVNPSFYSTASAASC